MDENSLEYLGVIQIIEIDNLSPNVNDKSQTFDKTLLLTTNNVKTVRYPDCQQLIIWLPQSGTNYNTVTLKDIEKDTIVWVQNIDKILNGSVQLIFNTLPIPDGNFEISIVKSDGLVHFIKFKKYIEGTVPIESELKTESVSSEKHEAIVYKDGFGREIPDEDLLLREKVIKKTFDKITRRLEYIIHGKDGEVIYIEGEMCIKFLMEMGAYDCVFYVNIPTESDWEKATKFPLSEREEIIVFVAERTQRDQAPSCVYKIADREITYFRKKVK